MTSVSVKFICVHISTICSLSCCCLIVFSCDVDSGKLKMIMFIYLYLFYRTTNLVALKFNSQFFLPNYKFV